MLVERGELPLVETHQLPRLFDVLLASLEGLPLQHRAPHALHGPVVHGNHLDREHALELAARRGAAQGIVKRLVLALFASSGFAPGCDEASIAWAKTMIRNGSDFEPRTSIAPFRVIAKDFWGGGSSLVFFLDDSIVPPPDRSAARPS
ncbi:hypothetical protein [Tsuneonella troitsensis]|uniref:hypothetical protein n=1 Tax=Tsuneonella troitsensis TaxID=292222 RepID=UPI00128F049F|nr:hypothetical protein [Tsuneonella troitsensis]